MRSKCEGFSAAPAEAGDSYFPIGCGNFLCVISRCVQVSIHALRIKTGDCFDTRILISKFTRAAAIWTKTGEQIGSNYDKTLPSQLIRHFLGPVGEAEYFMNQDYDRSFAFDFGVNDKCLNGTVSMLERHIFMMAGRGIEAGLRPVLCLH